MHVSFKFKRQTLIFFFYGQTEKWMLKVDSFEGIVHPKMGGLLTLSHY